MADDQQDAPTGDADDVELEGLAADDVESSEDVDGTEPPADRSQDDGGTGSDDAEADGRSDAKKKADAVVAERTVTRRVVTSKRVTPKAGAKVEASEPSKARNAKVTEQIQARYTPPTPTYAKGPSPWWVPAIMFGLLIVGALIIMTNYMGLFGEAENIRLVIGLGFILGGIVTATQYR